MMVSMDVSRPQLRRLLRAKRRALSSQQQQTASQNLYGRLASHPVFRRARRVAFYLPADGELDPSPLLQAALARGKAVYIPVLRSWPKQHMVLQRLTRGAEVWHKNRFGIQEPRANPARQAPVWSVSVLFLPLVGFDASGNRLGMGGGFYDRALAFLKRRSSKTIRPLLLGLAHECQKVDGLPVEPWDVPVQAVITDQAVYGSLTQARHPPIACFK